MMLQSAASASAAALRMRFASSYSLWNSLMTEQRNHLPRVTAAAAAFSSINGDQQQQHIIILGGGIAGLSTARYLLRHTEQSQSVKITLIDRNIDDDYIQRKEKKKISSSYEQQQTNYLNYSIPSRRNGNVLCPSLTIPWTTRSLWEEVILPGIKSLFAINNNNSGDRPTITFDWQALLTDRNIYSFAKHYLLQKIIYHKPEHQSNKSILDYNMQCLDDSSDDLIQGIEYGRFAKGTRLLDGSMKYEDSSGDVGSFCYGLLHQLIDQYEDRFTVASGESVDSLLLSHSDEKVDGVITINKDGTKSTKRGDQFVISMGVESTSLCNAIHVPCPVYPVKGHLATISSPVDCNYNITLPNGIGYAAPMDHIDPEGRRLYRLSGFVDLTPRKEPDQDRIDALINAAKVHLGNDVNLIDASACHRPFSADDRPIIGPTYQFPNLFLCTGFGSRGWSVGVGSGSLLSSLILQLPCDIDPEPYSAQRFISFTERR
jgi:hypothetical protein